MPPQGLAPLYQQLIREFSKPDGDMGTCGKLLTQLKIGLSSAGLLPPQGDPPLEDLGVTREILEIGAFWSIRAQDIPSFDRYFAQVQAFYSDYEDVLPDSPRQRPLQGLNLIRLLTQNRIADFHTTLESLPSDALHDDPYIRHPVNLERWLMEGSYSKVWNAREEAPAAEYRFFVDSLMGTIRNEIASCGEVAYESLPVHDAASLLFFPKQQDLITYAQQRGWQIDLTSQMILFTKKDVEKVEIPKEKMITAALHYARELEQIV
jgi:26S proteasome regulatory subunit N12